MSAAGFQRGAAAFRDEPGAAAEAIATAFERGAALAVLCGPARMARRATLRRLARLAGRGAPTLVLRVDGEGPASLIEALADALEAPSEADRRRGAGLRRRLRALAGPRGAPLLVLDDADRATPWELVELVAETRDPETGARLLRIAFASGDRPAMVSDLGLSSGGLAALAEAAAPERIDLWVRLPRRLSGGAAPGPRRRPQPYSLGKRGRPPGRRWGDRRPGGAGETPWLGLGAAALLLTAGFVWAQADGAARVAAQIAAWAGVDTAPFSTGAGR